MDKATKTQKVRDLYGPAGRLPVFAAFGVMLFSVFAAMVGVATKDETAKDQHGSMLLSRDLEIREMSDGAIGVFDVESGDQIENYAKNRGGFIRAAKRGIDRVRDIESVPSATPFQLASWSDGAITLRDTGTGKVIVVSSFGLQNKRHFTALLTAGGTETAPVMNGAAED